MSQEELEKYKIGQVITVDGINVTIIEERIGNNNIQDIRVFIGKGDDGRTWSSGYIIKERL